MFEEMNNSLLQAYIPGDREEHHNLTLYSLDYYMYLHPQVNFSTFRTDSEYFVLPYLLNLPLPSGFLFSGAAVFPTIPGTVCTMGSEDLPGDRRADPSLAQLGPSSPQYYYSSRYIPQH